MIQMANLIRIINFKKVFKIITIHYSVYPKEVVKDEVERGAQAREEIQEGWEEKEAKRRREGRDVGGRGGEEKK